MRKSLVFFALVLFLSNALSRNLSNDISILVRHNLLQDDYAELMKQPDNKTKYITTTKETGALGRVSKRVGDMVYFVTNNIHIYDLETSTWAPELVLNQIADSFVVGNDVIFVSHGNEVYKYPMDGSPASLIFTASSLVEEMVIADNYLVAVNENYFTSINMSTDSVVETTSAHLGTLGVVYSVVSSNIYFLSRIGISPRDIHRITIDGSGHFGNDVDSPYHGNYPIGTRVYYFPYGNRLVDESGIVYFSDLTYAGSLGGAFDHIDFYEDLPIVLRDNKLVAYSNTLVEAGEYQISNVAAHYVKDGVVHWFTYNGATIVTGTVNVADFSPVTPGEPVNPVGLVYEADAIVDDGNRYIYLLSRNNLTIFVYDSNIQEYVDGIPLIDAPLFLTYSPVNNMLYAAYSDKLISAIDPVTKVESGLVNSPQTPCGLSISGNYVFVCDPSGAWVSHMTYDFNGFLIDQKEWNYVSDEYHWNDVNNKMYHFRDSTSPNDLLWEDINPNGTIGNQMDSPYHGDMNASYPLCVNPDGSEVILGDGEVFDAITLIKTGSPLTNSIKGCVWVKGKLYTYSNSINTELQSWNETNPTDEQSWSGSPIDLIGLASGALIIIREIDSAPKFDIFNDNIFENSFD